MTIMMMAVIMIIMMLFDEDYAHVGGSGALSWELMLSLCSGNKQTMPMVAEMKRLIMIICLI